MEFHRRYGSRRGRLSGSSPTRSWAGSCSGARLPQRRTIEMDHERERLGPSRPTISVMMPVHNAGRYVAEAVESILGQTFTDFELLLIDDGSTDNSAAILARYAERDRRIRF